MNHDIYIYLLVMSAVTLAIRILPVTLIRRPIKNQFLRSFLFYVPYVTLAVMTFPAIMDATPLCGTFGPHCRHWPCLERLQPVQSSSRLLYGGLWRRTSYLISKNSP